MHKTRLGIIGVFLLGMLFCSIPPAGAQTFSPTGSMGSARDLFTATVLPSGKVLIAGGSVGTSILSTAELYDPSTGVFTPTGSMGTVRTNHTATLLPNGKVLIAGGQSGTGYLTILNTTELYDPATGSFAPSGSMLIGRYNHTATLLPNGNVLIAGGTSGYQPMMGSVPLAEAEIYNSAAGTFSSTGSMNFSRVNHTATLLNNGTVLMTGGSIPMFPVGEIFDPAGNGGSGAFTDTGYMNTGRAYHTATLLLSGKVLITGGTATSNGNYLNGAELYDPATGTYNLTNNMSVARSSHTATLLPNGKVLVAGGYSSVSLATADIYDPTTGLFVKTGNMNTARSFDAATMLSNGKVLVAGGYGSGFSQINSAELYTMSAFPDLVLQNSAAQKVAFWFTSGANVAAGVYAMIGGAPITLPPNWQVVGSADFNGDGTPDLVLDNTSTGQIAFWYTSANVITGGTYATSGGGQIGLPAGWQIVGTGDFNQDGKPDLVLQNTNSGILAVWEMNGTDVTTGVYVTSGGNPIALPVGWQVVGVGDINGDGYPDLVLVNSGTGQIAFWLANGTNITSGVYATNMGNGPLYVPSGWQIAAVGPYLPNGSETLVLQNLSSRLLAFWYLNGPNLFGASYALTDGNYTTLPPGWQVSGPR